MQTLLKKYTITNLFFDDCVALKGQDILFFQNLFFSGPKFGILDTFRYDRHSDLVKTTTYESPDRLYYSYDSTEILDMPTIVMKERFTMLTTYKRDADGSIFYQPVQAKQFCYKDR